jgi:hypothetical protein
MMPEHRLQTAQSFREQAVRCRRMAAAMTDRLVSGRLEEMAAEFDERADAIDGAEQATAPCR